MRFTSSAESTCADSFRPRPLDRLSRRLVEPQHGGPAAAALQRGNHQVGMVDFEEPQRAGNMPRGRGGGAGDQGVVQLQAVAIDARTPPIAGVRHQGVGEGQLLAQFKAGAGIIRPPVQAGVGAIHRRAVGQRLAPHEGKHHRPVGDVVAGKPDVEQGQAVAAIAVIDPVWAGISMPSGRSMAPKGISWTLRPFGIEVGKRTR